MDLSIILNVPTLKANTFKQSTRDDRLHIQALYYDAGFSIDETVLQLSHLTKRQVTYALDYSLTSKKKAYGRRPFLNTPRRKFLIDWVYVSKVNKRIL